MTGPEKTRLFSNIDIPNLFPTHKKKAEVQLLWTNFFIIINSLSKKNCDPVEFDQQAKEWVNLFTSIYQKKDVTPYMHCLGMHVSQFLSLHGDIISFSQQGLEKLNDIMTIYFQHSSNHREKDALKQMLQKQNRIEDTDLPSEKAIAGDAKLTRD